MFDRQNGRNEAAGQGAGGAAEPGSFRARLMARQAARPQSTLAIDNGIVYRPGSSSTPEARRAAEAVRDEIHRRRAEAARAAAAAEAADPAARAARAEAERVRAAAVVEAKAPPSDAELVSVIEEVAARKVEEQAPVVIPSVAVQREAARPDVCPQVAERDAHEDVSTRTGDISQLAFAGLAVLGLAGLSVLAAQNAFKDDGKTDKNVTGATETDMGALAPDLKPGGASSVALASAVATEEPKAWFNYQGVADMLAERKAEMEAEAKAAQEAADKEARLRAATVIAEAEAARVAEEQAAAVEAAEQALLAEAAERQRLADAEAARVAQAEADRLARLEAQRLAAAEAEAQRVAELEAKRQAEADAETQRLADLDAQRLAKLRAEREAAEQAARQEAFELAKAQEAERLRIAELKAQAEADAAEARRLEQVAAKAAADRLAAEKLLAEQRAAADVKLQQVAAKAPAKAPTVAEAPKPQPIVFTAYEGKVPAPASYKPEKPAQLMRASYTPDTGKTVTRKAPAALTAGKADVRSFAEPSGPQTPEAFLASRVERASSRPVTTEDMDLVQQAFRSILDNGADGSKQAIITPDGRPLTIILERTVSREMGQSTVRTVSFTPGVGQVTRVVTDQAPVTVSVMCRDVAYAFAGQERGRFAACQAPDGGWTLARATDVVKVTTASLPNSAS
jgi:hypothetical protein